jgi:CBS domain-containing protein
MNGRDTFDETIRGLEAGLRVEHIATFDLKTCGVADPAEVILGKAELKGFDRIPVRGANDRIVGVLSRDGGSTSGPVAERMEPLSESLLVPAGAPLLSFILAAKTNPYRLVLTTKGIEGIVTRSDLLKLPVRLLAFALVTHLEMLMARIIRKRFPLPDNSWLQVLTGPRQKEVQRKHDSLARGRMNPDILEFTEFCDKRDVVANLDGLTCREVRELASIQKLRDSVAHAATFIHDDASVSSFFRRIDLLAKWISQLQCGLIGITSAPVAPPLGVAT